MSINGNLISPKAILKSLVIQQQKTGEATTSQMFASPVFMSIYLFLYKS